MKFGQIGVIGSYGLQAAFALGTVLVAAQLLDAQAFGVFSLAFAGAQFGAVLIFEWIRLCAMRFYPGSDESAQRAALLRSFKVAACALVPLGVGFWGFDLGWPIAILVPTLIVLLGFSDLQQTMTRFRGDRNRFMRMQSLRAALAFSGAAAAAWYFQTGEAAVAGLAMGHATAVLTNRLLDPPPPGLFATGKADAIPDAFLSYGPPAALASVFHSSVPMMLRAGAAALFGLEGSAALLLALDLVQRPFALASVAINGAFFPDVMRDYHAGTSPGAAISRLMRINAAVLAGGVLGAVLLGPWIVELLVPTEHSPSVIAAVPALAVFFALRAFTQNVLTVRDHLSLRSWSLAATGLIDATSTATAVMAMILLGDSTIPTLLAVIVSGAGVALLIATWRCRKSNCA